MNYVFTGAQHLTAAGRAFVYRVVAGLTDATEFTSGCAHGVETFAAMSALECHPDALHRLVVPAAPHNEEMPRLFAEMHLRGHRTEVVRMPAARTGRLAYRQRNEVMVGHAKPLFGDVGQLVAFPRYPERWASGAYTRSGTWMTVRIAHRVGVPVQVHMLP